jgi:hypothetical protein
MSIKIVVSDCNKTIKHIFFCCQHVLGKIVYIAVILIEPLRSISHMLGICLASIEKKKCEIFCGCDRSTII